MHVLIVTDAWLPQINGVVRTLQCTRQELQRMGHRVTLLTPEGFRTIPCPTYPEIRLSVMVGSRVRTFIESTAPDALHIATEGPLGQAARRYALSLGLPFTTAYHSRFPEYVRARIGLPLSVSYRWLRGFHGPAVATLVPTPAVRDDLVRWGFTNAVIWSRGVDTQHFHPQATPVAKPKAPVFLYLGRVAVEKNVEAFLALDLPGEKWVVGDGPQRQRLAKRYPDVRWLGAKTLDELPAYYTAADVMVFPSLTDTFGLVLLEAMACGCPVAAFPVAGPIDVVGTGGVLDNDLRAACLQALQWPRAQARAQAERHSWGEATRQFLGYLRPWPGRLVSATAVSAC